MAIVDNTLVFSDGQAITAGAGSTNIIDTLAPGTPYGYGSALTKDNGIGHDVPILVSVTEAFNTLTSLTVSLQVDNDVAFGSPKTVATSGAIPLASLTLGYQFKFPAELLEGTDERYIRLYYDVTGLAPTLGKIFAGVVGGRQTA